MAEDIQHKSCSDTQNSLKDCAKDQQNTKWIENNDNSSQTTNTIQIE